MTEFHKIWIEQCEAAEGIQERFGTNAAIRYLIGEKLINFLQACHDRPEFANELPLFIAEIKRIFQPFEIAGFFANSDPEQVPDSSQTFAGDDDDHDDEEEELDEYRVLSDAEDILLIENAKSLLLG